MVFALVTRNLHLTGPPVSPDGRHAVPDLNEKRVTVPEAVMFRELEGEAVLLNLDSEVYFGLDEVGTRIWHALSESGKVGEAVQRLLGEFEVDEETVRKDLAELLEELVENGLVTIDDG